MFAQQSQSTGKCGVRARAPLYLVVKFLPFLGLHLLLLREVRIVGLGHRYGARCIQQLSDDGLLEERVLGNEREFNLGQRCSNARTCHGSLFTAGSRPNFHEGT